MLVLARNEDQQIRIGTSDGEIVVTICRVIGSKVRVGIEAPSKCPVHRQEVWDAIEAERKQEGGQT